jgi:hypothetical protein
MEAKEIVDRLSLNQLLTIIQRFGLNPIYKNPQKRKVAIKKCVEKYLNNNGLDPCVICYESMNFKNVIITPCTHFFCDTCLIPHINKSETCPICRGSCPYTYVMKMIPMNRLFLHIKIDTEINIETVRIEDNLDNYQYRPPFMYILASTVSTIATVINIVFVLLFIHIITSFIIQLTKSYSIYTGEDLNSHPRGVLYSNL